MIFNGLLGVMWSLGRGIPSLTYLLSKLGVNKTSHYNYYLWKENWTFQFPWSIRILLIALAKFCNGISNNFSVTLAVANLWGYFRIAWHGPYKCPISASPKSLVFWRVYDMFRRFWTFFRRFLECNFWALFRRFLDTFGRLLTLFGRFLPDLRRFLDAFWMLFGYFWALFGRFLDAFRRFVCNYN